MTPEQHQRVKSVFSAVSKLSEGDRAAYLERECGGEPEIRGEVEALLGYDTKPSDALKTPALGAVMTRTLAGALEAAARRPPPARLGPYSIQGVLGEGGMGVVYVAEQERPKRTVALKVIRRGLTRPSLTRRFELEAELLGRLQHPGIAQIYEAGVASHDGEQVTYLAMELVRGTSITEYCERGNLGTRQRLALMVKVCEAVHHAHQRGVIHRDLKPGNILVAEEEGNPGGRGSELTELMGSVGQPKVLDFGVARATDSDVSVTTMRTSAGQLIGTLPYMSPEQVAGDPNEIDTRSDVYAMGVILYQLLSGRLPHDLESRSIPEAARVIRDEAPRRLSTINRVFRGEIETIVAKALEKDKARRYQSAAELGEDLRRHLEGLPILAKDDSALYVLRTQIRRYKELVAGACAVVIGLGVFAAYASVRARREAELKVSAQDAADVASEARDLAVAQKKVADERAEELRRSLYVGAIGHAHAAFLTDDTKQMKRLLESCPVDLRGWEWRYLSELSEGSDRVIGGAGSSGSARWISRDGERVLAFLPGQRVRDVRTREGTETWFPLRAGSGGLVLCNASELTATVADGRVEMLSPTGEVAARWDRGATSLAAAVAISPDDSVLVTMVTDGTLVAHDTVSRRVLWGRTPEAATGWEFSEDGTRLAMGTRDGTVVIRDARTGAEVQRLAGHEQLVGALAFSPDGTRLATGSHDTTVRVWELNTGRSVALRGHRNKVWTVRWTPDGQHVVTGGSDSTLLVSHVDSGRVVRRLHGHESTVVACAFRADGTLVSVGIDGSVRVWKDVASSGEIVGSVGVGEISVGAAAGEGGGAYVGASGMLARVRGSDLARDMAKRFPTSAVLNRMSVNGSGTKAVVAADDGMVVVVGLPELNEIARTRAPAGRAIDVDWDPVSDRFVIASNFRAAVICDGTTAQQIGQMPEEVVEPVRARFSHDGKRIVTGGYDGRVSVYDAATGTIERELAGLEDYATMLCFWPDNRGVIGTDGRGTILSWDFGRPGGAPTAIAGHTGSVYDASFSADGTRLVTGGWDNSVRVWTWPGGDELLTLRGHTGAVVRVWFTPDSSRVISVGAEGVARMWGGREAARTTSGIGASGN